MPPRRIRSTRGRRVTAGRPILLAAGGTGGHLFPAEALAVELARRGVPVELITDERARAYAAALPGARAARDACRHAAWTRRQAPTASSRLRSARGVLRSLGDPAAGASPPRSSASAAIRPSRRCVAARMRRHARRAARAERRDGPRQPHAGAARAPRSRPAFRPSTGLPRGQATTTHVGNPGAAAGDRGERRALPGACRTASRSGFWCSAAARARA